MFNTLCDKLTINGMNTKILTNFGEQVRKFRLEQGYTQETFAEKLGVHKNCISFIERGKRNTSLLMIFKISRALKIKLPTLFEFDR